MRIKPYHPVSPSSSQDSNPAVENRSRRDGTPIVAQYCPGTAVTSQASRLSQTQRGARRIAPGDERHEVLSTMSACNSVQHPTNAVMIVTVARDEIGQEPCFFCEFRCNRIINWLASGVGVQTAPPAADRLAIIEVRGNHHLSTPRSQPLAGHQC